MDRELADIIAFTLRKEAELVSFSTRKMRCLVITFRCSRSNFFYEP